MIDMIILEKAMSAASKGKSISPKEGKSKHVDQILHEIYVNNLLW